MNRIVCGGNLQLNFGELDAVKPDQPRVCAHPHETVGGLDDRGHGVRRQTLGQAPYVHGFRLLRHAGIRAAGLENRKRQSREA